MPSTAVLSGLLIVTAFCMSHSSISVPSTEWVEPVLLWISIGMPTGSGKSPLYKFLLGLLRKTRVKVGLNEASPSWLLEEATFEKMGAMMSENNSKLLGLYDELSSFLTQINLYKARGLSDSHDLALFLQLYNGHPWSRKTGMYMSAHVIVPNYMYTIHYGTVLQHLMMVMTFEVVGFAMTRLRSCTE